MVKNINVLFAGMLLLLLAVAIPSPIWALWMPIEGYGDPRSEPIKNTEGATELVLRLDSNGFPHIAWLNNSGICYLKWDGVQWVDVDGLDQKSIKVPGTEPSDSWINMCLDSAGHPHMAWHRFRAKKKSGRVFPLSDVYYLRWNGKRWVDADGAGRESTRVGNTIYGHICPSLCLDSKDRPHLALTKEYPSLMCHRHICYLRWNGSQWVETGAWGQKEGDIFDIIGRPESVLLCLDSNNDPYMVLELEEEVGHSEIRYAYWWASRKEWWRGVIKYKEPKSYLMPSLRLDSKNRPHIAFCGKTKTSRFLFRQDIYYLWWNGSGWVDVDGAGQESEVISNGEHDSSAPSLCLDSRGYPHIAWLNEDKGGINYLHWDGNKWVDPEVSALPKLIRLLKDKWKEKQWWTPDFLSDVQEAAEAKEFKTSIGYYSVKSPFLCLDSKDRPHIAWIKDTGDKKLVCYAKWISAEVCCEEYTHHIKGYVRDENGKPVSGVKVTLSGDICGGAYTTSKDGYYEFIYLLPENYTVTPHKSGCSFSPGQYEYGMLESNKENQDFKKRSLQE